MIYTHVVYPSDGELMSLHAVPTDFIRYHLLPITFVLWVETNDTNTTNDGTQVLAADLCRRYIQLPEKVHRTPLI